MMVPYKVRMPGSELRQRLHMLRTHNTCMTRYFSYSHFYEETRAQRGEVIWPRSPDSQIVKKINTLKSCELCIWLTHLQMLLCLIKQTETRGWHEKKFLGRECQDSEEWFYIALHETSQEATQCVWGVISSDCMNNLYSEFWSERPFLCLKLGWPVMMSLGRRDTVSGADLIVCSSYTCREWELISTFREIQMLSYLYSPV